MLRRSSLFALLFVFTTSVIAISCKNDSGSSKEPAKDTTGLVLPAGFRAEIVADTIGHIRHLAVNEQGDLYIKLGTLDKDGKGIVFLRDTDHDGVFDQRTAFGNFPGTGILINKNTLYAASNSEVFRYALNEKGEVIDTAKAQRIVTGLADHKADNSKSIAMDEQGNLYVTVGSWNEGCNPDSSLVGWPGCPLLDSVGGVWQFKSDMTDQTYAQSVHYYKGLKNIVGLAWNGATHSLFGTNHGRGRLWEKFPQYYTKEQNLDLPAETLYELKPKGDGGWPFVYYDQIQKKQMLSPEYGGDGKKTVEGKYDDPAIAFPGHLAPNDLLFYTGNQFPEKYKNGAFMVFHARSIPQKKGYLVAFVPFKDGKPTGEWEVFADNFVGIDLETSKEPIKHRPMGIAQGPDGSLYVADDVKGTVYRIRYSINSIGKSN